MFNISCTNKSNLLNSLRIVKAMACFAFIVITLTSCSQKNSIDNGSIETPSVETPSVETPSEEDGKIEISMEDVISIGKDEAAKYYDDLQLTNVYSYDNDYV